MPSSMAASAIRQLTPQLIKGIRGDKLEVSSAAARTPLTTFTAPPPLSPLTTLTTHHSHRSPLSYHSHHLSVKSSASRL